MTVLAICLSLVISRWPMQPQACRVLAVLRAQQDVATRCAPRDRLLLVPYAKEIAQIDATACPGDFFHAWKKYVSDVQALSAIEHAETGKAIVSMGAAVIAENPGPVVSMLPEHPVQAEIARNATVADWQNVKQIALRYRIRTA